MIRAAIIGVGGRMGQALVRAAADFEAIAGPVGAAGAAGSPSAVVASAGGIAITAAVASAHSPHLGKDAGELAGIGKLGVTITADLAAALARADVAIDFSNAAATRGNLAACRQARKPLLIGTTGFSADAELEAAAKDIPLLVAPNTSLGVTLLIELVRQAAAALPPTFDIEIIEAHHRLKKDAPSGTALALGNAAAEGRGLSPEEVRREGAPRRGNEIGYAVVRAGDIVGEHSVLFAGMGESLTLSHRATDRSIFARGALRAAVWLQSRAPGRYFMRDLFTNKSGA